MRVLELFCGTKSISNAFKERGHQVFTVDWEKNFEPDLVADIGKITIDDIIKLCGGVPDVIWTNHPNPRFKPPCKNGDKCHEAAPRGSRTGTQRLQGSKDRSRIPKLLCEWIVKICEEN